MTEGQLKFVDHITLWYKKAKGVGCKFREKDIRRLIRQYPAKTFSGMLELYFIRISLDDEKELVVKDLILEQLLKPSIFDIIHKDSGSWGTYVKVPFGS